MSADPPAVPVLLDEGLRPSGEYRTAGGGLVRVSAHLSFRWLEHEVVAVSGDVPDAMVTLERKGETVTVPLAGLEHHRERRLTAQLDSGAEPEPIRMPGHWLLTDDGWLRAHVGRKGGTVLGDRVVVFDHDGAERLISLDRVRRTVWLGSEMRWHGHWFWARPDADDLWGAVPLDAGDTLVRLWYRDGDAFDEVSKLPGVIVKHPYAYDSGPWVTLRLGEVEEVRMLWEASARFTPVVRRGEA